MDTSETYIKMCEKAEDIQDSRWLGGLVHGDYFSRLDRWEGNCDIFGGVDRHYKGEITKGFIWLPRQDQLQKMAGVSKAWHFLEWIKRITFKPISEGISPDVLLQYDTQWSMEQLWLAFVMQEKYGKVWNEEEWKPL